MKSSKEIEKRRPEDKVSEKKTYTSPVVEEHNTLEKASGCHSFNNAYISGYGYYH